MDLVTHDIKELNTSINSTFNSSYFYGNIRQKKEGKLTMAFPITLVHTAAILQAAIPRLYSDIQVITINFFV